MWYRSSIGAFALAVALTLSTIGTRAFDETKYPNWKGQWVQLGGNQDSPWDPTKPPGAGQQAPLTPEYRAIFEANVKSAADGGLEVDPTARCVPAGVPRVMMGAQPMEIVITPDVTYFMLEQTLRRVHTDGRKFPDDVEPSFSGRSARVTSTVSSNHSAKRCGSETSSHTGSGGAGTTSVVATVRSGLRAIARAVSTKTGRPVGRPVSVLKRASGARRNCS